MDDSWPIKKAECWKIDAFELWCWRRLLRVPWTARRFNQSILKEIIPGCSLEGLMLKLKLQYFGHLMWRADSFEKTLMLGKIEGRRRRGWQRMRWFNAITDSMDMSLNKFWDLVIDREDWCATVHGVAKRLTWLSDWNELNWTRRLTFTLILTKFLFVLSSGSLAMDLLYSSCYALGNVIELQNLFIFLTHYLTLFIIFYIYTYFNRMIKKNLYSPSYS